MASGRVASSDQAGRCVGRRKLYRALCAAVSANGETNIETPEQQRCSEASLASSQSPDEARIALEERMRKLEEQLQEMKKLATEQPSEKPKDEAAEKKNDDETKRVRSISQARFLTVEDFDKRDFSFEKEHYAIDVVTTSNWRLKNTRADTVPPKGIADLDTESVEAPKRTRKDLAYLSFIQINSRALIEVLKHTTEDRDIEWPTNAYVILAPFKSIRYQEHNLRQWLAELHQIWSRPKAEATPEDPSRPSYAPEAGEVQSNGPSASSPIIATEATDEQPETAPNRLDDDTASDGLKAYQDLLCLMSFWDQFVAPWWDHLRSPQVTNVQFGDLCALYRPGDLVVMPDDPQRVTRVIKLTGARPTIKHLSQGKSAQPSEDSEEIGDPKANKDGKTPQKSVSGSDETANWTIFDLDCYYIDYDGKAFAVVHKLYRIRYFSGTRDVKQLRPYPMRYAPSKTRQEYLETGEEFFAMASKPPSLHSYDGRTLATLPNGNKMKRNSDASEDERNGKSMVSPEDVDAQVVIDFDSTFMYNTGWAPDTGLEDFAADDYTEDNEDELAKESPLRSSKIKVQCFHIADTQATDRYRRDDPWVCLADDDTMEDRQHKNRFRRTEDDRNDFLLLPNRVFGYVLRSRSWACFDLTGKAHWRSVKPNESSWADLQIAKSHRTTLLSLVQRHFTNRESARARGPGKHSDNFDFIEGKGKGLIVLLHGAPGVGKTSTAESIASKYGKPLLPITCGNLGLDARSVEQALQENFRLAETWGCVVLLDEADVFLARREKNDLARNALVSVFLRTLEYYTGILFLTTNRTGDFDEAFRSRIHVALLYTDLTEERTKNIWQINLRRLVDQRKANRQPLVIEDDGQSESPILRFAMKHWKAYGVLHRSPWNGRQIRNAFQTAVALAEYEAEQKRIVATERGADEAEQKRIVPELNWQDFLKVAVATNQFEVYLLHTRGWSEDERAAEESLRAKYSVYNNGLYGPGAKKPKMQIVSAAGAAEVIERLHPDHEIYVPEYLYESRPEAHDPLSDTLRRRKQQHPMSSPMTMPRAESPLPMHTQYIQVPPAMIPGQPMPQYVNGMSMTPMQTYTNEYGMQQATPQQSQMQPVQGIGSYAMQDPRMQMIRQQSIHSPAPQPNYAPGVQTTQQGVQPMSATQPHYASGMQPNQHGVPPAPPAPQFFGQNMLAGQQSVYPSPQPQQPPVQAHGNVPQSGFMQNTQQMGYAGHSGSPTVAGAPNTLSSSGF